MALKIIFDASVLVSGKVSGNIHKTGLYRVSYELLKELEKTEEIELYLFDIFHRERELVKFVQIDFPKCNCIKVYSAWYKCLIFPVGNFADYFRNRGLTSKSKLTYAATFLLKNWFLFVERVAKKIEKIFFVKKNLDHSIKQCEVYYSLYYPIPLRIRNNPRIIKIYTVHDLIPIFRPEYFSSPFNEKLLKEVLDSIRYVDYTISVSENTKKDILIYRPDLDPNKIIVTPLACSKTFDSFRNKFNVGQTKNKYKLNNEKYLLSVCTVQPRKNLRLLVDAYQLLLEKKENIKLVLTGSYGWNSDKLINDISTINEKYNNPIVLTGFVSDEELADLYHGAFAFIFPSLYEGFGLPVLEAMRCGAPVICSNTTSLPEVIGDCGIMINPTNVEELFNSIESLLNDENLRISLSERAKERSMDFQWEKTADKVSTVFKLCSHSTQDSK